MNHDDYQTFHLHTQLYYSLLAQPYNFVENFNLGYFCQLNPYPERSLELNGIRIPGIISNSITNLTMNLKS